MGEPDLQRQIDQLTARLAAAEAKIAALEARPVPFNRGALDYARPPVAGPSVMDQLPSLGLIRR
jgi:hypothetical protein